MRQKDYAIAAGCTQATMCRYMLGTQRPKDYETAARLAGIFGTTPEIWLKGDGKAIKAALASWAERQKSEQPEQAA